MERSPADVVRVVTATAALLALLLLEWVFGDTLVAFGTELLRGLDAVPQWIVNVVVVGIRLLAFVVLGGGLVWIVARRRGDVLLRVVAAGVLAAALFTLVDSLVEVADGAAPVTVDVGVEVLDETSSRTALEVGVVAAVLTAAAPWMSRRWRRAGWAVVVGLAVTRFVATPVSFDAFEAAILGWLSGAGVLVVLGAPSRRPTPASVITGLADVGLAVQQLDRSSVDARGSKPYLGVGAGGERLFVKALGEDERGADVLFRLYRRIAPRDFGDEKPFSTLRRAVEHEAFVALAVRDLGLRTPRLRAFATAEPNGYVLAYDAIEGRSLDRIEPDEITDHLLLDCWRLVAELRRHRIAHRDLRLANLFVDERGAPWLIDFSFSEMAASERLLVMDVAELLASSSLPVGPERAVANAAATVDRATLVQALDRLHPWALSGATRTGLKARPGHLDELRDRLHDGGATRAASRREGDGDRRVARGRPPVNLAWLIVAAAGLIVLVLSTAFARMPTISTAESRAFHLVNGLPDWLYWPLWLPMQLGNLVVGTAVGLVVAVAGRHLAVALGVLLAAALKIVTERIVRREMADYLEVRQRPGTSQVGARRRGDVPSSGPSFPSGHVILVAGVATVVAPTLIAPWASVAALAVVLVMLGRVYIGAHNPLDVTAGLGAGLLLGGIIAVFVN